MQSISGKTRLYAIIAHPTSHVRAPEFFNPVFERKGMDALLIALDVPPADLASVVPELARIRNLGGLIVTIPHKEAIARLCHELGPNGKNMGAVNTVRFDPGARLVGEMFDGVGLLAAARSADIEPKGKRVLLLGAGGAGRAIAFAMAAEGVADLAITNRSPERAEALVRDIKRVLPEAPARAVPADATGFDLVVNCTSLGLHAGDPMPLDPATLSAPTAFIDIIAVRDTEIMDAARAKGCKVVGGRPMAELQIDAQLAFLRAGPG